MAEHASRTLLRHIRRQHPQPQSEWLLGWRNIYVLPTRAGWVLLTVLLQRQSST